MYSANFTHVRTCVLDEMFDVLNNCCYHPIGLESDCDGWTDAEREQAENWCDSHANPFHKPMCQGL